MVDPTGKYGIPGLIYGGIAGAAGGFVASGSGWKNKLTGIVAGGVAGAAVGFVAPAMSGAAGTAVAVAAGGVASVTGQVLGSGLTAASEKGVGNVTVSDIKVDPVVTAVSALAAGLAAPVGVGMASVPATQSIVGNTLSAAGTPGAAGVIAGATAEGAIIGAAERLTGALEEKVDLMKNP